MLRDAVRTSSSYFLGGGFLPASDSTLKVPPGVVTSPFLAAACFSRWMASYTSFLCTGTCGGALMPSRTFSPRMSTTVISMSSPIIIVSSRCLDSTSIGGLLPIYVGILRKSLLPQVSILDLKSWLDYNHKFKNSQY